MTKNRNGKMRRWRDEGTESGANTQETFMAPCFDLAFDFEGLGVKKKIAGAPSALSMGFRFCS